MKVSTLGMCITAVALLLYVYNPNKLILYLILLLEYIIAIPRFIYYHIVRGIKIITLHFYVIVLLIDTYKIHRYLTRKMKSLNRINQHLLQLIHINEVYLMIMRQLSNR